MSKKDNKEILNSPYIENGNLPPFSKPSIFPSLQSVSVETNIRNDNDSSAINEFFGLEEAGVQTDLTNRDIDELFRSKLCGLDQQELLEFLKAEEQFYHNPNEENFLDQKRNKSEDVSIENKKEEAALNGNLTTNSNSKLDVKKENSNLSVNGATKKQTKKKIDAFFLFKEEYRQMHKIEDEETFEKECRKAWCELSKDLKKMYNINAENEYKKLKKQQKMKAQQNNNSQISLEEDKQNQ